MSVATKLSQPLVVDRSTPMATRTPTVGSAAWTAKRRSGFSSRPAESSGALPRSSATTRARWRRERQAPK